jgi:hypothetical protein
MTVREEKQVLLSMVEFGKEGVAIKLYFSCRTKFIVATETWHWIKTGSCYKLFFFQNKQPLKHKKKNLYLAP